MISDSKRRLYRNIVIFLRKECSCNEYSEDTIESLEVAKQCIESAFEIPPDLSEDVDLLDLLEKSISFSKNKAHQASSEEKMVAENFKSKGNALMLSEKFDEAIDCYSKAIALDPSNAIYYCNRAAAKSHLGKHDECVVDCEKALEIDPSYSKAYGRMGLAYCNMGKYEKATEAYKKAVSLDPNNPNFKKNLALAEAGLKGTSSQSSNAHPNNFSGLDLGALLNNPMMQNMAQRLMTDPQMQSTVSSMMQGILTGTPPGGGNTATSQSPNMDDLLRYGQQFAQHMQQTNPDLVNTLRQQMQNMANQQAPTDGSQDNADST